MIELHVYNLHIGHVNKNDLVGGRDATGIIGNKKRKPIIYYYIKHKISVCLLKKLIKNLDIKYMNMDCILKYKYITRHLSREIQVKVDLLSHIINLDQHDHQFIHSNRFPHSKTLLFTLFSHTSDTIRPDSLPKASPQMYNF